MAKKKEAQIVKDHFGPFLKAKEDLDKKIRTEGETAVKAYLKEYFDNHPDVYGIKWTQYTPHFNDGDACVFGLHTVSAFPTKKNFDDNDDYEFECYGEEPETTLNQIEDILEVVFGDHAEVRATRDSIEVEEYEHD